MEAAAMEQVVVAWQEALWVRLVGTGVRMGLPFQDAEDVAQDSILAAMGAYDPARGDFGGLAFTTYRNRVRNALSRRRPTVPADEVDPPDKRSDPLHDLLRLSHEEAVERVSAAILALLDESEARLFYELGRVLEERESRAVSEAARRLGLTPQRGWDLFRRIQRKARGLGLTFPELEAESRQRFGAAARPAMARPAAPPPAKRTEKLRWCLADSDEDSAEVSSFSIARQVPAPAPAPAPAQRRASLIPRPGHESTRAVPDAIRRPWAGFRRFLERIGADGRRRLSGIRG